MNNPTTKPMANLAALLTLIAVIAAPNTLAQDNKLLTAKFDARRVVQVEAGDFHFKPGQVAPIHTHEAPAVGYVAKGSILYQVEGEKPRLLNEGDAFYEPAGPRILRFDNASATEEAIFLDFNLEKAGEPFIVFEQPPTEAIDRRTLPTVALKAQMLEQVDIYTSELKPAGKRTLDTQEPTLGLVAEGIVVLRVEGQPTQRIAAGETFSVTSAGVEASIANASSEAAASVITFKLL